MKRNMLAVISAGLVSTLLMACGGGSSGGSSSSNSGTGGTPVDTSFTIASTVVAKDGTLPTEFACAKDGGQAIPPSFYWKNPPKDTGSYILTIERIGDAKNPVYPLPASQNTIVNIDGGVLSTPSSNDLTGLGDNVFHTPYTYGVNGYVPCRYFKVLATPEPEQYYKVTIIALSKNAPVLYKGSDIWGASHVDPDHSTGVTRDGRSILESLTYDPALHKEGLIGDYVIGRASMTFKY